MRQSVGCFRARLSIEALLNVGITNTSELECIVSSLDSQPFLTDDDRKTIRQYYTNRAMFQQSLFTAADMLHDIQCNWRDITCGSSTVNQLLHGGLKHGTITELDGWGGTGKTQFCLTFCAYVQLPSTPTQQYQAMFVTAWSMSCRYIDTENTYSAIRQAELLKYVKNIKASLDNIFVWQPSDVNEFLTLLQCLPSFLDLHPMVR